MFYAQFVLSKKGPLAKIWLAAHWEKKLTKNQVYETNVADAVDAVLEPKVKMALRTTGHLLLGIVRIYSRKAKYLLADCNEAFLKIKMAFRPGQVDLPEEGREAAGAAINLPEVFADFDAALPDFQDFDNVSQMAMNQSRIDDITMKEDLPSRSGISELGYGGFADDFGDAGMDGLDSYGSIHMRDAGSSIGFTPVGADAATKLGALGDLDAPIPDDFGGQLEDNIFMDDIFNDEALLNMDIDNIAAPGEDITTIVDADHQRPGEPSLNLDPLEATVMQNLAERAGGRGRRKRRLVVDEVKNIPGDEMKAQLQDYSDLVRPSVLLAPPTKRLMVYDGWPAEKVLAAPTSALLGAKGLNRLHAASLMPSAAAAEAEQERMAKSALIDELNLNRDPSLALPEEPVEEEAPAEMAPSVSPPPRSPSPAPLASPTGDSPSKRRKSKPANRPDQSALEESGEVDESGLDGDEKKFTRRTAAVLQTIRRQLEDTDELTFTDICGRATRKTAAAKFYTLLTLKKWEQVAVEQTEPFGPIQISLGAKFGEIPVA